MSILGNPVPRVEDERFLTVGGDYVGDMNPPGAVHVVYVRSTMAHATVVALETEDAAGMPGVVQVLTAAELDLPDLAPLPMLEQAHARPPLARDVVRFVGEPIAVVAAETEAQAIDAAEMVFVDLEPLDPVIGADRSRTDSVILHQGSGTNLTYEVGADDPELDFGDCEVAIELDMVDQRLAACPIEPRVAVAMWEDDRLVHYASSQGSERVRAELSNVLDLDRDRIRVVTPDVGGGFGAKANPHPEEIIVGVLAHRLRRPVKWVETRTENMQAMTQGRGQLQHIRIGGTRDGRITHYQLRIDQDAGAYPVLGAALPSFTRQMASGVYDIPNVSVRARSWVTSTPPVAAYRGAGRPEAAAAIERAVDRFASEIGLDPVEVRRNNLIPVDAFPYTTVTGAVYDSGDYEGALDRALEAADYSNLRAEQARRREMDDPVLLGIGVSTYVEVTAGGGGHEFGTATLTADGGLVIRTGSTPYGQGHVTTWAMIASSATGVPIDRIRVIHGDTDEVDQEFMTVASRSVQLAGSSVLSAAEELVDLARTRAADLLEAAEADLVFDPDGGCFHVAGSPARKLPWADVAGAGEDLLVGVSDFDQEQGTYPFGAHVAVVEVDRLTGGVRLTRMIGCDDAGVIVNPLIATGQIHGGMAIGAAQALWEEVTFDELGNPTSANFADYGIPSSAELPRLERVSMETPTPLNPLGAKGIGESGTIGSIPAVHNAVCDALAPLGIGHVDMPCTPQRVWRAIRDATAAT